MSNKVRVLIPAILSAAMAFAFLGATQSQETETVVPGGSPTPVSTAPPSDIGLDTSVLDRPIGSDRSIRWQAVSGAASYRVILELQIVRVNAANPGCAAPSQEEVRMLSVDETIPGTSTSFEIPLPSVPAIDTWRVGSFVVDVRALDGSGAQVGGQRRQGVVEGGASICSTPTAAARPIVAPSTGTGSAAASDLSATAMILALALGAAGLLSGSLGIIRR